MKLSNIIIILILSISSTVHAQISKRNWMMGGNGSFSSSERYPVQSRIQGAKIKELIISGRLGYFFVDKFVAGAAVKYYKYDRRGDNVSNLNYGLYSRYYILNKEKVVNIFAEGGYYLGRISFNNAKDNDFQYGYSVSAGPSVFFNQSVAMELGVEYSSSRFTGVSNDRLNALNVFLGFQIFLEK